MNQALALRRIEPAAAIDRLLAALADPTGSSDLLADVLNDAGTRDALLATAAMCGRWDDLADAARAGGAAALVSGRSVYGPLTVLGVAHWLLGQERDAAQMLSAVPPADPAHRLADLAQQLIALGTPAAVWVQRMQSVTVGDCLAFRRPSGPPEAPPPGAERWFLPPGQDPLAGDPLAEGPAEQDGPVR